MLTLKTDLTLAIGALLASAWAMVIFTTQPADPVFALAPLAAFVLLYAAPVVVRWEPFALIGLLIGTALVLDEPHNFAYNEWNPLTKILGPLLFERLRDLVNAPGLIITPFEVLSLGLALWLPFRLGRLEWRNLSASQPFRLLVLLALSLPLVGLVAIISGFFTGGELSLALTQLRPLPAFGVWLYLGYLSYQRRRHIRWLLAIVIGTTAIKCLQGWWAFLLVYGGAMGNREYLMEHITSEPIVISLLTVGFLWWHQRRHLGHDLAAIGGAILLLAPYFLNLRRASFLGLGFTLALLPSVYWRQVKRRHLIISLVAVAALATAVIALWDSPPPFQQLVYPFKRFLIKDRYFALDYRDVENFNQFHTVMAFPFTGHGFGHRLTMFMELTDISALYPLYDVLPHNNVLFMWAAAGPLGAAAMAAIVAFSVAVALRLTRLAQSMEERLLGFLAWGMVIRWLIYVYTDLGLVFFRLPALLGLVIGMVVKALAQAEPKQREGLVHD